MRRMTAAGLAAFAVLLGLAGRESAEAKSIKIVNTLDHPITRLEAWPDSQILPSTANLLSESLEPGATRTVQIEDEYHDCTFDFEAGFNLDPWNFGRTKRPSGLFALPDVFVMRANICSEDTVGFYASH